MCSGLISTWYMNKIVADKPNRYCVNRKIDWSHGKNHKEYTFLLPINVLWLMQDILKA